MVHVSVRPPCHPRRSHFASPVGDHDYPCTIFPAPSWLKRSLAYTPCEAGLPPSSIAACHPSLADTESGMDGISTTRHDREPLRTLRRYLSGSRVKHDLDQRYQSSSLLRPHAPKLDSLFHSDISSGGKAEKSDALHRVLDHLRGAPSL